MWFKMILKGPKSIKLKRLITVDTLNGLFSDFFCLSGWEA